MDDSILEVALNAAFLALKAPALVFIEVMINTLSNLYPWVLTTALFFF